MRIPAPDRENNKSLLFWLTVIMIVRITSYFMLSESVAVTQFFKIIFRLLVSGISFLILWNAFRKNKGLSFGLQYPMAIVFYIAYLLLGMYSLLWTTKMSDSILQLLMDVECLVFSVLYINIISAYNVIHDKKIRLSKILSSTVLVIMLSFILGMFINPDKFYRLTHGGEVARLGGFIINPNELGMLIVTGFAMCCAELKFAAKKGWLIIMMAVFVYTLILTGSRSSMIGLFLILLYYIKKTGNIKLQLGVLTCMVLSVPFIINQVFIKAGDTAELMNMTGRIPFWNDLLNINFPKAPILGYGFMRIDVHDKFESINSYAGEMTHNTFIQVLLNLGLVGLLIIIFQLASTLHAMIKDTDADKKSVAVGLFIPALINSFTEFGIFGETNYSIMFYLFIVFMYGMKVNNLKPFPYKRENHAFTKENKLYRPSFTP